MDNALKFTPEGSVEFRIDVLAGKASKKGVRFTFLDTGIGIKEKYLAEIFKPFTQQDPSTTRCYQGVGLGLSICKIIVKAMKGTINIESQEGQGTKVSEK